MAEARSAAMAPRRRFSPRFLLSSPQHRELRVQPSEKLLLLPRSRPAPPRIRGREADDRVFSLVPVPSPQTSPAKRKPHLLRFFSRNKTLGFCQRLRRKGPQSPRCHGNTSGVRGDPPPPQITTEGGTGQERSGSGKIKIKRPFLLRRRDMAKLLPTWRRGQAGRQAGPRRSRGWPP